MAVAVDIPILHASLEKLVIPNIYLDSNNITLATARTSLAHRPYSTKVGVFFKASRWVGNSDVQA